MIVGDIRDQVAPSIQWYTVNTRLDRAEPSARYPNLQIYNPKLYLVISLHINRLDSSSSRMAHYWRTSGAGTGGYPGKQSIIVYT